MMKAEQEWFLKLCDRLLACQRAVQSAPKDSRDVAADLITIPAELDCVIGALIEYAFRPDDAPKGETSSERIKHARQVIRAHDLIPITKGRKKQ